MNTKTAKLAIVGVLLVILAALVPAAISTQDAAANPPPPDPNGCVNGETFNPFEDECEPNGTKHDICHVAGLASDPANYLNLNIAVVAIFGPAGHFNENGTPNAGHEEDSYGVCNPPPPPFDECPNIPGNQPPGTNCEPPGDDVNVEAGVIFIDGDCDTLPFIDVTEEIGIFYTHDGMTVGDHEVEYLSSGTIVAHDAAPDDGIQLVGPTDFPFAFTFDPAIEECGSPPPCQVNCEPVPPPPPVCETCKPDEPNKPPKKLPHTE